MSTVSCDSQRVSDGRGTLTAAAALAAAMCALLGPVTAGAADGKAKTKFVFLKARVGSDGVVTPSQPETISVSRMAPEGEVRRLHRAAPDHPAVR